MPKIHQKKTHPPPPPRKNQSQAQAEIDEGARFAFGANWQNFLSKVNESRINSAETSLKNMLGVKSLAGKTFCDIGCGSGLFSLAAQRLGARVHSFDYDPNSVACTQVLRSRFATPDKKSATTWQIEEGSVLDTGYMARLGKFDIVYSWGVLHHTGEMWRAIIQASHLVKAGGLLYIAIYNDAGVKSRIWWIIKYIYLRLPKPLRPLYAFSMDVLRKALVAITLLITFRFIRIAHKIAGKTVSNVYRGMTYTNDLVDWYGGMPYEFATYAHLVNFMEGLGFRHVRGYQSGGWGNHELVFQRPKK